MSVPADTRCGRRQTGEHRWSMEHGITKKQSAALQGVAIWMMVYHHIFLGTEAYEGLFSFMTPEVVRRIAWFCKICVGVFAFVSGYGMYYGMERLPKERFFGRLGAQYRYVLPRILKLYVRLWIIFAVHLAYLLGVRHIPVSAGELLGNATALTPSWNGTWWYVEQYAKMLLLLPLMDLLLTRFEEKREKEKKMIFYVAVCILPPAAALAAGVRAEEIWMWIRAAVQWLRPSFLAVFAAGYLMARCKVYERVDALQKKRLGKWERPGAFCLAVAWIGIVIAVRVTLASGPAYADADFVLTPLFVYGILTIFSFVKPVGSFFAWWGRYSTYIWLVHNFFHVPVYNLTKLFTRLDFPVYLGTLAISALIAVALTGLEAPFKRFRR